MNFLYNVQGYWNRVPHYVVALILGALTFRIFLIFVRDNSLKKILIDKLWYYSLIFLIITRFSGQILHPTTFFGSSIYQIISGSSSNGWVLGLFVSSFYIVFAFYREKAINVNTLYQITIGVLISSLPVLLYKMLLDLNPYYLQDIIRLGFIVILLLVNLNRYFQSIFQKSPHRLWLVIGVLLLVTSALTPQFNKWLFFSSTQWMEILLILIALTAEGWNDLKKRWEN